MTHTLAMEAARDAGNRHALANGRIFWTQADWYAAKAEYLSITGRDIVDVGIERSHISSEFLRAAAELQP